MGLETYLLLVIFFFFFGHFQPVGFGTGLLLGIWTWILHMA